jgi:hypothetical protein
LATRLGSTTGFPSPHVKWLATKGGSSGLRFEEDIITLDHDLRRFQYSIVNNLIVKSHLGTVDVIPDGPNRCMVMYGTDIDPEPMGLIIIGAAGAGLEKLKEIFAANGAK